METLKSIEERRSIRGYTKEKVSRKIVEDILNCGRLAPSAKNRQPWYFVITKGKTKDKIADMMIEYTINNDDTILKNNELVQIKNNKVLTTYEKIENNNLLYSWSFDGNKMTADDIKLNIDLNLILGLTPNKDKIDALIPSSIASLKLDFQHKGNLPLGTSLKVNIGSSFKNDDILDLYYYNPEANKLEKVAENIMVIDGFASLFRTNTYSLQ